MIGTQHNPRETLEHDAKRIRESAAESTRDAEAYEIRARDCRQDAADLTARAEEFEAAAKLLPQPASVSHVPNHGLLGGTVAMKTRETGVRLL